MPQDQDRKRKPKKKKSTYSDQSSKDLYYFDEEAADRVIRFAHSYARHQKGEWAGQLIRLDQWEIDILRKLFGWKKKSDGTRRYKTLYLEVPRKNGKSLIGAVIALYMLISDGEPGAEVYSAATDRKQASIVFDVAAQIVKADQALSKRCKVYKGTKTITVERTNSKYVALSADAFTKDGLNASCIIFDELHAQKKRELYDVLRTSMAARRQPLEVYITTAGSDIDTICGEVHDYATKVADGTLVDDSFLGVIFAADKDDDWTSPKVWAKANPGFGVSVKLAYLEDKCREAQNKPSYENTFKRNHLNIWTEAETIWIPRAKLLKCKANYSQIGTEAYGQPIWVAVDLSKRVDITAVSFTYLHNEKVMRNITQGFMPEEVAKEREQQDRIKYSQWAKEGWLTLTEGDVIDIDVICDWIDGLAEHFDVQKVGVDPWGSQALQTRLIKSGAPVMEFRQGTKTMSPVMKDMEAAVQTRQWQHNGNPMLLWMFANLTPFVDSSGNMKPDKSKRNKRIDGAVTSIMSAGLVLADLGEEVSIYETEDIKFL
ncbi:MAG: terminase large subunit [Candidatus Melainabacteria bacterium]|nr:MAG: terminase large subunit [Candidatus Melainabacteria bacterium]